MKRSMTIRDIAAMAGVSVGTASMALNDAPNISEKTKRHVLEIAKTVDYRRNPHARSLSLNRSKIIAFIAPYFTNPFYANMAEQMQKAVENAGYSLMLGLSGNSIRQEQKLIDQFLDYGADGIVLVPTEKENPDPSYLYKLRNKNFPIVSIAAYYKAFPYNCIMTDLKKGSYLLTRYLLKKGRRYLILLSGKKELIPFQTRIEGFEAAHAECAVPLLPGQIIQTEKLDFLTGAESTKNIVLGHKPDAILAMNDFMATGILNKLIRMGVKVPKDISIAGYDDIQTSALLETPLTTVSQPICEMCTLAVGKIIEIINGGSYSKDVRLLEPQLIIRESTR